MTKSDVLAEKVCGGGICSIDVSRPIHSRFFKSISILISVFAFAVAGAACGRSDKKDDVPEHVDAEIVVADAGVTEHDAEVFIENTDANVTENDAGVIEDNDASIIEDDAGIIEDNDACMIEDDAGTGEEDIKFISIPAGSFVLSHDTELYKKGDTVRLSVFALKKTPVTVAEFEKCVAAEKCTSRHYRTVSDNDYCNYNRGENWKNHPMNCIDWYGAKQYCEWIGGRLPTEEEWEYAATHNGTAHLDTTYPWGNDAPQHCVTAQYFDSSTEKYCQGNAAAPMSNDDYEGTSDVSLHSPAGDSPLGLVDMAGNVWEWTNSLYELDTAYHIVKGGFWNALEDVLSAPWRGATNPSFTINIYGFRCAK